MFGLRLGPARLIRNGTAERAIVDPVDTEENTCVGGYSLGAGVLPKEHLLLAHRLKKNRDGNERGDKKNSAGKKNPGRFTAQPANA